MEEHSKPPPPKATAPGKRVETRTRPFLVHYYPGGFHPVHLGDTFKRERYTIIHKLGHGGFATVWLARDSVRSRYVALKILAARLSRECPEVEILRLLQAAESAERDGRKYVMSMLDHFWVTGPNGKHLCVVSQVGGPSIKLWNESPGLRPGTRRLKAVVARKVSLQAAQGLAYIHSTGIVHGDEVHERLGEPQTQELEQMEAGSTRDPSSPRYTVDAISMRGVDPRWLSDQIMIIDFGIAFSQELSSSSIGTPKRYCAPEFLFDIPRSIYSDTWALGCTIFEIRTGAGLFGYKATAPKRDLILRSMVILLGSLPPSWWDKWEHGREWYASELNEGGELYGNQDGHLYNLIMEIGRFDGDALPKHITKYPLMKDNASNENKPSSSTKSSTGTTRRLISMIAEISTDEAAEILELAKYQYSGSGSGPDNEDSDSASDSSNKKDSNSGSSNITSLISSEGLSTGKIGANATTASNTAGKKDTEQSDALISKEEVGVRETIEGNIKASMLAADFLEPAGTMISSDEAKMLENLLRKALKFIPEERAPPAELAQHEWFYEEFEVMRVEDEGLENEGVQRVTDEKEEEEVEKKEEG